MSRRGASRGKSRGGPALLWLFAGILIGLGMAWYMFARGWIPQVASTVPAAGEAAGPASEAPLLPDSEPKPPEGAGRSKYDFFTVLPEMEVVVPEQELAERTSPENAAATGQDSDSYLLQVGSFQTGAEADAYKAQLALIGVIAEVQTVTVNDATWHRVRVGPVAGAQQADDLRRKLQENGMDALVMKNPE